MKRLPSVPKTRMSGDQLLIMYQSLVKKLCMRFGKDLIRKGIPLDDIVQETNLRLIQHMHKYDYVHSVSTFIGWHVRSVTDRMRRKVYTQSRNNGKKNASLDARFFEDGSTLVELLEDPVNQGNAFRIEHADLIDSMDLVGRRIVGERNWEIFKAVRVSGVKSQDVAKKYGISPGVVSSIVNDTPNKVLHSPIMRKLLGERSESRIITPSPAMPRRPRSGLRKVRK